MKLKIYTEKKEVTLLEKISVQKLIDTLKALFPTDHSEYTITTETQIIYNTYPVYRYTDWWYHKPSITYAGSTADLLNAPNNMTIGSTSNTFEYSKLDSVPSGEFLVQVY